AFVAAVATEETLDTLNYWLIAFSAGFIGAGVLFMRILSAGAVGLVAANKYRRIASDVIDFKYLSQAASVGSLCV
ncbi:108_t:CDS:2, partial [Acaulospora colombiana]